jgi:hypothetical protein
MKKGQCISKMLRCGGLDKLSLFWFVLKSLDTTTDHLMVPKQKPNLKKSKEA